MRKPFMILLLGLLLAVALACQVLPGGGDAAPAAPEDGAAAPAPVESTEPPVASGGGGEAVESEFPMPEDAFNIQEMGEGMANFQTKMSLEAAVAFYRQALTGQGLTEREITTTITDTVFSIVFDGHSSGKAVVVQGVELGDGSVNINIRLEDN